MNERIRELAEQAWDYAMAVHDGHIVPPLDKEVWPIDNVLDEKFAELIVEECMLCCEQVISDPVPKDVDTWLNGGEQCIQEIKQHWGLGMSVEDKKQLIKDLLGVSNDTKS